MKNLSSVVIMVAMMCIADNIHSNTIIVDINGGGHYTSIQTAINNASTADTVKVWPGNYFEKITLNKNIVLMGSGYENTIINGNFNPTVNISSGKILWFTISSLNGNGIKISGGTVSNCVINGCAHSGIYCDSGTTGLVINCVIVNNGNSGIDFIGPSGTSLTAMNCISRNNGGYGFNAYWANGIFTVSYSNGSRSSTNGNQGCIDLNPMFTSSTDFHLSEGSPCWNTGNPSLFDPDGSRSDMGYFGGPNCPIYPTVFEIILTPSGNNVNIQAKGRANY